MMDAGRGDLRKIGYKICITIWLLQKRMLEGDANPERDIYDFVTKGTYSMELRTFVSGRFFFLSRRNRQL
jgi:hypothetical protein